MFDEKLTHFETNLFTTWNSAYSNNIAVHEIYQSKIILSECIDFFLVIIQI